MENNHKYIVQLCGICEHEIQIKSPIHPYKTVICKNCNAHYLPEEMPTKKNSSVKRKVYLYAELIILATAMYLTLEVFPDTKENHWRLFSFFTLYIIIFSVFQRFVFGKDPLPEYKFKLVATPKEIPESWQKKERWAVLGSLLFTASLLGVLFLFIT
ncbi:hypothetical protein [Pelagibaculum spongiae]|nr:hypothetical protein [Pelagibaculum spongiae]